MDWHKKQTTGTSDNLLGVYVMSGCCSTTADSLGILFTAPLRLTAVLLTSNHSVLDEGTQLMQA
jgi:hypothetical protein